MVYEQIHRLRLPPKLEDLYEEYDMASGELLDSRHC